MYEIGQPSSSVETGATVSATHSAVPSVIHATGKL
jgi:hypothetical protein